MNLHIGTPVRDTISAHAMDTHPNECCGFLYGFDRDGEIREIHEAVPVTNSREGNQRDRFEIRPEDYLRAEEYAKQKGFRFIGIYHSHPDSPAVPSQYDLSRAFPFFSYIIVSVSKDKLMEFRSWILDEEMKFKEEGIAYQHSTNPN